MMKLHVIVNDVLNNTWTQKKDYDKWYYDGKSIIIEKDGYIIAVYSIQNIIGAFEDKE